ncbi:hypothetical protein [Microvirga aerophila]|nr:hypothetical protein [Microvirga aerophila]
MTKKASPSVHEAPPFLQSISAPVSPLDSIAHEVRESCLSDFSWK